MVKTRAEAMTVHLRHWRPFAYNSLRQKYMGHAATYKPLSIKFPFSPHIFYIENITH
ncbi:hypothetical protein [Microscilla marina]|uniref:Uncharacterized protein n=1 Tax=Microscilla marina ATCC 23134 TaxID=313606 RepID=A1ZNH1_MICM2|nr:hypothetical protein [Microscilla marina]EAY28082.1 hypothetical protein M23134_02192 [Microscilla marina ATCC 23134]